MGAQQLACRHDLIGAPNPELQHTLSAEAWLPKCYKKMPRLGKSVEF
jgi:hypothetical protein